METATKSFVLSVLLIALATVVSCSCPHPPSISSISPTSATVGNSEVALTINGNNFVSDSVVDFDGTSLTPTFVNSHQLTVTIPAANIAQAGTFQVLVLSPPSSGTSSNPIDGVATTTTNPTCSGYDSNGASFTVSP
jgi:trimeric autotransporter adhesin